MNLKAALLAALAAILATPFAARAKAPKPTEAAKPADAAKPAQASKSKAAKAANLAGTYVLDQQSFLEKARAAVARMPEEQRQLAEAALASLPTVELTLALARDGGATVTVAQPAMEEGDAPVHETRQARWSAEGEGIVIVGGPKDLHCRPVAEGLMCSEGPAEVLLRRK